MLGKRKPYSTQMVGNDGDESHGTINLQFLGVITYNPYFHFLGVKPSFFMVLGSKGMK